MEFNRQLFLEILLAIIITISAYLILQNSTHPARTDLIIEGLLFTIAGIVGLRGYLGESRNKTKLFHRFELFYFLTYSVVAIACIMGIIYLFNNPSVHEIGLENVKDSLLLQIMSAVKSASFIFMFLAWFFFYRNLNIQAGKIKKIVSFLIGFGFYFGFSLIILSITGDTSIVSLGIIVGAAIGLFAMIALHPATRFLSLIFFLFSLVHLWEFYLMGMQKELVTGINNPVYWFLILLYALEVNRWIQTKQYRINS